MSQKWGWVERALSNVLRRKLLSPAILRCDFHSLRLNPHKGKQKRNAFLETFKFTCFCCTMRAQDKSTWPVDVVVVSLARLSLWRDGKAFPMLRAELEKFSASKVLPRMSAAKKNFSWKQKLYFFRCSSDSIYRWQYLTSYWPDWN